MMDVERASAAQRRRGRRLRAALRHERQSIAMALAESQHHTSRGQKKARAGEEESELHYTDKDRKTPPPQPVLFKFFDEEPGGGRPEAFVEPRPQERVLRHTAEQLADVAPMVPSLAVPEPHKVDQLLAVLKPVDSSVPPLRAALTATQMVEQLVGVQLPDILSFFDALMPDPEQVIEVPKILLDDGPMRAAVRDTQLGEQFFRRTSDKFHWT